MAYTGVQPVARSTIRTISNSVEQDTTSIEVQGGYPVDNIKLYIDGSFIPRGEYTATDGATIQFDQPLPAGTFYTIEVLTPFQASDHYSKAEMDEKFEDRDQFLTNNYYDKEESDERHLNANKNYIMNPCFRVDQRGITSNSDADNVNGTRNRGSENANYVFNGDSFIQDRWYVRGTSGSGGRLYIETLGGFNFSQGPEYLKITTVGMTDHTYIQQRIEDINGLLDTDYVTISFLCGISQPTNVQILFRYYVGETMYEFSKHVVIDSTDTDSKGFYTATFDVRDSVTTIKTGGVKPGDKNYCLFRLVCYGNSKELGNPTFNPVNGVIRFSQIKLEKGRVQTPFEDVGYAEEVSRCRRYYYEQRNMDYLQYIAGNSGRVIFTNMFPTMRVSPAIEFETDNAETLSLLSTTPSTFRANFLPAGTNTNVRIRRIKMDAEI